MVNSKVTSHNLRDLCKARPCLSMGSVEAPNSLKGVPLSVEEMLVEKQKICIYSLCS